MGSRETEREAGAIERSSPRHGRDHMFHPVALWHEAEILRQYGDDLDQAPTLVECAGMQSIDAPELVERISAKACTHLHCRNFMKSCQRRRVNGVLNEAHAHWEHRTRNDIEMAPPRVLTV